MSEALVRRLETLRAEYKKGQERLAEVCQQHAEFQETMLRIEGAMSVLQEVLNAETSSEPADPGSADAMKGPAGA